MRNNVQFKDAVAPANFSNDAIELQDCFLRNDVDAVVKDLTKVPDYARLFITVAGI